MTRKQAYWKVVSETLTCEALVIAVPGQDDRNRPVYLQEWDIQFKPFDTKNPTSHVSRDDVIRMRNFLTACLADSED